MSRQKMGFFSTLATVGAVGAAASIAWRWAQRQRGAGSLVPRDLTRWEGEGGAVTNGGDPASQAGASAPAMSERPSAESSNGTIQEAWPFPHGTRH